MAKKFIAVLLVVLTLLSVSATVFNVAAAVNIFVYRVDKTTNQSAQRQKIAITRGASYTIAYSGTSANGSYTDDGVKLTNGNAGNALATYHVGFNGSGTTTVIIDMGSTVTGFTDFYARCMNDVSAGIGLPSALNFYVSTDGTTFYSVGDVSITASPAEDTAYSLGLTNELGCAARYIKAEFVNNGGAATIACAEISAYIWADVTTITASGAADTQGLVYTANAAAKTAYVASYTNSYSTTTVVQGSGYTPTTATGRVNNTTWYIGNGCSEANVKVTASFVSASRSNRPGLINNDKRYIVIHNTGNYGSTATALANHNYQTSNASCTQTSWHYTVGKDGIYQGIPDNENAWHASDGSYGTGNYYGIGMEVCVNGFPNTYSGSSWTNWLNSTFYTNCRYAAMLTAELCVRWNLNPGDCSLGTAIRQHYDSNQKNCPQQMRYNTSSGSYTRNTGDMWVYFKNKVSTYYTALKGGGTTTVVTETPNSVTDVSVPQYVYLSDSNVYCRVTGVASAAFASKSNLTSVYLPNTITWGSVASAYASSGNLVNINVSPTNAYIYSTGGKLYSSADKTLIASPAKNSNSGTIKPDAVVYDSSLEIVIENLTLINANSNLVVDKQKGRFKGLGVGKNAGEISTLFEDSVVVKDKNGAVITGSATVGTGCVIESKDGLDSVTVVILGDITGDGLIGVADYISLKSCIKGKASFEGAYRDACDFSSDDTISSVDYIRLRLAIKGK